MSPNTAAPHVAKLSKSLLSIFAPIELKTFCKVERNSDGSEKNPANFGNQPENPARGCNSAKGNVPHMYITCQEVLFRRARKIQPPASIWETKLSIPQFQISILPFEISKLTFERSNPAFEI
jgi:hypothetical protein